MYFDVCGWGGNRSKSHSISVSFRRPNMDKLSHAHEITYPFPNFNGYTAEDWE